ncbi:hypothetical protein E1A91_D10G215500v1 [Gossypium mustelinum]|uniref:HIG1 domain-containing protein n=1 Tax=Gossypium mustelinum TaxID=34275 RepID=A0A5D2TC46_GOSMU|nr:hypothetical protein E1A91_D10G215500v1 [Gossypium mustelinum]
MDTVESIRSWVSTHKLTSIAIGASMAYTGSRTALKPSLRLIHARMHAQAFTLTVLSGAAAYHYYDKSCRKQEEAASA